MATLAVSSQALAQVQLPSGPPYITVSATGNTLSTAIGDMNGDGHQDVVIGLHASQHIQVVPGDGQGGFGTPVVSSVPAVSTLARPRVVVLGDVNGDNKLDVVSFDYATSGALWVSRGDGAGNLGSPTAYNFYDTRDPGDTRYVVWSAVLGDVNRDGKPDLIVGAANNFFTSKGDVWVLLNDGSGNFGPATIVWTRSMGHGDVPAQFVAAGDLDGDGNGDIVVTSGFGVFGSGNAVTILYGDGEGAIYSAAGMPFPNTLSGKANQAQSVVIAAMNGDTWPDLVVSASDIGFTRTGGVTVFLNTGQRTFDAGATFATAYFRNGMAAVGDLNGDGWPDVVTTGASTGDSIAYHLNDGSGGLGTLENVTRRYIGGLSGAFGLAIGDLTHSGPGTQDVVVGTTGNGTKLLQNGPAGPIVPPDTTPPTVSAPAPLTVECNTTGGVSTSDPAIQDWLASAGASDDVDGAVPVSNDLAAGTCAVGAPKTITFSATDSAGNTGSATSTITVVDTVAPSIGSATASPGSLWPPNHRMALVSVAVPVSDACDAGATCQVLSVTSNEPVNGLGDGDTAPDWVVTGPLTVDLRAERSGKGSGRVYTIMVQCADASGNRATKTVTVTVPKSQGK